MSETKPEIGKLELYPIRKVFPKEASHFTVWLEEHIDTLSERLNMKLSVIQREKSVGEFNVDLLCEDSEGRPVIIENQLEKTDHDHLGKLLTYLVNLTAGTAIWITSEPRVEHQKVIDWLNESTPVGISFYLVKVDAIRIGNSPFAPLFTISAGPDPQTKEIGEKKKEWAETHFKRYEFWKAFLERAQERTKLLSNITPSKENWISTGAGKAGIGLNLVINMDWGGTELYIDHDKETGEKNKAIFDALFAQKTEIEKEFGSPLDWERMDDKRASRIRKKFNYAGLAIPEKWQELHDDMIESIIKLGTIFRPRLQKIKI